MPKQTLSPNIQEQLHQAALLLQEHGELLTHELAQRLGIKVYNPEGNCTYEARHLFSALDNDARFEVIRGRLDVETAPARVRLAHPAKAPEPTLQEQADQGREAELNRAIDELLAEGKPFSLREVCRRAGASLGEIHRFPAVKARAVQEMERVMNKDAEPGSMGIPVDLPKPKAEPRPQAEPADVGGFQDRLRMLMDGRNAERMAKEWNLGPTTIRKYLAGGYCSANAAVQIADGSGVSVDWLLTGRGLPLAVEHDPGDLQEFRDSLLSQTVNLKRALDQKSEQVQALESERQALAAELEQVIRQLKLLGGSLQNSA